MNAFFTMAYASDEKNEFTDIMDTIYNYPWIYNMSEHLINEWCMCKKNRKIFRASRSTFTSTCMNE